MKQVRSGASARSAAGARRCCFRVRRRGGAPVSSWKFRQQVVSEHHELLPRTVGGVGLGRDAVEGQPGP